MLVAGRASLQEKSSLRLRSGESQKDCVCRGMLAAVSVQSVLGTTVGNVHVLTVPRG